MNLLLIQCLRGNSIGQVKIELMNKNGDYYYFYDKNMVKDVEMQKSGKVLFVQYKNIKEQEKNNEYVEKTVEPTKKMQCCGMAFGTYRKIKRQDLKEVLKISVNEINFNDNENESKDFNIEESVKYKKIIESISEINSKILNNINYNIIQIDATNQVISKLESYSNDISKNDDEVLKNLKQLYKEFLNEDKTNYEKLYNSCEKMYKWNNEKKKELEEIFKSYDILERKKDLCELAQKSIYAKRVINKGNRRANRTEYQRDWERIIHSKSFRRLEDKAQIYTLSKGDHFRTRLTHTLEVTQIARGIARELDLNEDLVEAIALGHDLGHTPFGHVGERTLNDILEQEGVKGGFKHNFQGVKVVNYLEEKYGEFEGIDLTYQVMEGILKHTKVSNCKECSEYNKEKDTCDYWNRIEVLNCDKNPYQIRKFLRKGDVEKLNLKYNFSTTLEGQVVAVADEIAQRAHDLDDGIASGIINEKEFIDELKKDSDFSELYQSIDKSLKYIDEEKRDYIDILDIKRARIVSDVITYFIAKIIEGTEDNINKYKEEKNNEISETDGIIIDKELICFSNSQNNIETVRKKLEEMTSDKIIHSEEVNCFDGKGEYIIKKLYKAYITNPRQMSKTTLTRIQREMSRYTNDQFDIKKIYIKDHNVEDKVIFGKDEVKNEKHRIFVRCVIDLIAGMTDEFANKQFEKLYSPRTY